VSALEAWETDRVYGQARHYNYPTGWRVHCLCAEGRLGELLREHA
jgi:hypothetical protein